MFTKITQDDLKGKGVVGQPAVPGLSVLEMQEAVEQVVREVAIPAVNRLIEELATEAAAQNIGAQTPGGEKGAATLQDVLETLAQTARSHAESKENPHAVTAGQAGAYTKQETEDRIDAKVVEIGAGDMARAVYDPDGDGAVERADAAQTAGRTERALTISGSDGQPLAEFDGSEEKTLRLTKVAVGLGSVDNTADSAKKVLSASKAAGQSFALGAGNTNARFFGNNQNLNILLGYDTSDVHYLFLGYYGEAHALCPNTDQAFRLGTDGARWSGIWAASGTINTSDAAKKKDITDLEGGAEFIYALRPVSFKFIDGESGRTHWGLTAQDVKAVMDAQGITDMDFAGWTRAPKTERTEDGGFREIPGEYEYGLRYAEFIAPLIATVQSQNARIQELERRITAAGAEQ